ncbi:hypothetical protein QYF36_006715 [Acer negundo]|nr:hypothetical protein QYF36_006715 [Acer negundo]
MVDDLSKEGKLWNCMAVWDVSPSMKGTPMEVAVALGILVSELSEDPWKGKLITFSETPELQNVEGDDLKILEVAVEGNLKPEQMIKRLFVFSDMEFDNASVNPWETDYQVIVRKYTEKGEGDIDMDPEIVMEAAISGEEYQKLVVLD